MKKIRINFEKFSDGILIPQFPWPNAISLLTTIYFIFKVSYYRSDLQLRNSSHTAHCTQNS